jgi:Protein of unknown function (DUF3311)
VSETMSGTEDVRRDGGLRFSPWNLMLLLPFLCLVTPWWNSIEPRLFGMPFFYWSQFAFVLVGVGSVAVVYVRTRDEPVPEAVAAQFDVDELDERTAGQGGAR